MKKRKYENWKVFEDNIDKPVPSLHIYLSLIIQLQGLPQVSQADAVKELKERTIKSVLLWSEYVSR